MKKVCEQCRKEFEVPNYRKDTAKYCSRKCQSKSSSNIIITYCDYCGKKIKRAKHKITGKNVFCNNDCYTKGKFETNNHTIYKNHIEFLIDSKIYGTQKILIDLDDFDKFSKYKWSLSGNGYVRCNKFLLHRYLTDCPKGMVIDHINRNKYDNRKCNLRICTQQENAKNKGIPITNKTGVVGVSYYQKLEKYKASIRVNKKTLHLGYFKTLSEARNARKLANIKFGFTN